MEELLFKIQMSNLPIPYAFASTLPEAHDYIAFCSSTFARVEVSIKWTTRVMQSNHLLLTSSQVF